MTAKSIEIYSNRNYSKAEVEAIVSVAQDPFCPTVMSADLVDAAARWAAKERRWPSSFELEWFDQ